MIKASEYSKLSQGAFDLTIEPIVKLWGIGTDNARIPKQEEIDVLLDLINYEDLILDEESQSVMLRKRDTQLIWEQLQRVMPGMR